MEYALTALGLVILLLAGDSLVRGAVNTALRLGVPALVVSLTIVAFGTSAPELLISVQSAMDGVPGIALGNVVGSNVANVLLVLGVPALIATLHTSQCNTRKSYLIMVAATVLFIALAAMGQGFGRVDGMILLGVLAFVLFDQLREARNHRALADDACETGEIEGADPGLSWPMIAVFLVLGLVGLPLGAQILVDNATEIARDWGVSETVIGLTLIAIGTSLPELATTVVAAFRKQADVALGNVIGSNMFNLLAIIGVTTFLKPIPVDPDFLEVDFWVMLGASLVLAPFVFNDRWDLTKPVGAIFVATYLGYLALLVT